MAHRRNKYVGLARQSSDPSRARTTLVWLAIAQTHQEHELPWSGSQEPRPIKNTNYIVLAHKSPDSSRTLTTLVWLARTQTHQELSAIVCLVFSPLDSLKMSTAAATVSIHSCVARKDEHSLGHRCTLGRPRSSSRRRCSLHK